MERASRGPHRRGGPGRAALGRRGEDLAAQFLSGAGMAVVARNWRCASGEIDIVARDGATLVVVEVKTRTALTHGHPAESVTATKAARLRRLLGEWLIAHGARHTADFGPPDAIRIDVVAIVIPLTGPPRLEHLRGVA